jgi:hypothetical protein
MDMGNTSTIAKQATADPALHDANGIPAWLSIAPRPSSFGPRFICPETGLRFYAIPGPNGSLAVPGVTSLLSADADPEEKQRLRNWQEKELREGRDPKAGAKRGTRTHSMLEAYIRTGVLEPRNDSPEEAEAYAFAQGMERHLRHYDDFIWSEAPLRSGWEHVWSEADEEGVRLARVWSATWGVAGVPDLIGRHRRGLTILSDFKSSLRPYYRHSGGPIPNHCRTGYLKFKKTTRQLCLYRLAVKETLGIDIDALQIIVGLPTPGESQMFFIRPHEIELETEKAKQQCVRFWNRYGSGQLTAS